MQRDICSEIHKDSQLFRIKLTFSFISSLNIAYEVCTSMSGKRDYQGTEPTRYISYRWIPPNYQNSLSSKFVAAQCHWQRLSSVLRIDISAFVSGHLNIFSRGLLFISRHVRTSDETGSHGKTPSASTFAIFSVFLKLKYVALNRAHCHRVDSV